MSDETVFIGYGGGLFATVMGSRKKWSAKTPQELINLLDADGIDRTDIELIESDRLSCPDHALHPRDARTFRIILGLPEVESDSKSG